MKHETHALLQALKECAVEIGHSPSKREFTQWGKGPHHSSVISRFKTWSAAVIAAGLVPNEETQKTKTSPPKLDLVKEPEKVQEIIRETSQRKIIQLNQYKKILCIPDCHYPFVDLGALSMVYAIAESEKPDIIVQLGDLFDCYAQSKFPKNLNVFSPEAEWNLAKQMASDMWTKLRQLCPKAEMFNLMGNHDLRPILRMNERFPEAAHLLSGAVKDAFLFDGVTTIHDPTEELFIQDIAFIHGHYSGNSKHMEYMRMKVVHGHSHRAQITFKPYWDANRNMTTLWEMDCGYIGDPYSKALSYRAQRIHHWTHAVGLIDSFGPRVVIF